MLCTNRLKIASQQISDRKLVDAITDKAIDTKDDLRLLIESDYLYDPKPVSGAKIWEQGGAREDHRQCFLALIRAGAKIRTDYMSGALQHVNMIIAHKDRRNPGKFFVTSANFSPGSLKRHFNWGLLVKDNLATTSISKQFTKAWDGNFRDVNLDHSIVNNNGQPLARVAMGARGQSTELAKELIDQAQDNIRFAFFNISKTSVIDNALQQAANRGVNVAGIVDGDQQEASWDAAPGLKKAGIDIRYYPGILTGAMGRMHYKMFTVDKKKIHLTTANASHASISSLEIGVTLFIKDPDYGAIECINEEISRLLRNAHIPR